MRQDGEKLVFQQDECWSLSTLLTEYVEYEERVLPKKTTEKLLRVSSNAGIRTLWKVCVAEQDGDDSPEAFLAWREWATEKVLTQNHAIEHLPNTAEGLETFTTKNTPELAAAIRWGASNLVQGGVVFEYAVHETMEKIRNGAEALYGDNSFDIGVAGRKAGEWLVQLELDD